VKCVRMYPMTPSRDAGTDNTVRLKMDASPGPAYNTRMVSSTRVGCTLAGSHAPAFGFGTAPRLNTKIWEEMENQEVDAKNETAKQRFVLARSLAQPGGGWSPGPIYFPKSTLGGKSVKICGSDRWS
jgi:hypothetical protein